MKMCSSDKKHHPTVGLDPKTPPPHSAVLCRDQGANGTELECSVRRLGVGRHDGIKRTTSAFRKSPVSGASRAKKGIPTFESKEEEQKWAKNHMAGAFRIFAKLGFADGASGHISLRDPVNPNYF
ncbi:hypothetical protein I7I51_06387 [Histoplasma capsulatum]|uniref:Class II aldolase/adducin N-terminal domain-containing protein n=1 Tax=Ajellomyces capsulatus TaxID=5037 RepID=A0A8A1MLM8_AJECA|nr:hypothetical protein I7I51_06387 [Histoplasma capsulatum]